MGSPKRHEPTDFACSVIEPLPPCRRLGAWDVFFEPSLRLYEGDLKVMASPSIRVHQHAANFRLGLGVERIHPA